MDSNFSLNFEFKVGYLVDDAQLFSDNQGGWKLAFRLAVPSDIRKADNPKRVNFFAIVAYGHEGDCVLLQPYLTKGTWIFLWGKGQSRDIDERGTGRKRVVVETVLRKIYFLRTDVPLLKDAT